MLLGAAFAVRVTCAAERGCDVVVDTREGTRLVAVVALAGTPFVVDPHTLVLRMTHSDCFYTTTEKSDYYYDTHNRVDADADVDDDLHHGRHRHHHHEGAFRNDYYYYYYCSCHCACDHDNQACELE